MPLPYEEKKTLKITLKIKRKYKMSTQHDEVGNPPYASIWGHVSEDRLPPVLLCCDFSK